jgi:hypothetical protein
MASPGRPRNGARNEVVYELIWLDGTPCGTFRTSLEHWRIGERFFTDGRSFRICAFDTASPSWVVLEELHEP